MARCLVTGHLGYIGNHLFKRLNKLGHDVLGIDYKYDPAEDIVGKRQAIIEFDPEFVFHLAAIPKVSYSVENPSQTMFANVYVTSFLLETCKQCPSLKRFIFSSSSSVYGDGHGPKSPYALQKRISEMECKVYSELYNMDVCCLRYFNVYSADQPSDGAYVAVMAAWMKALREEKPLIVEGTGHQSRDFTHVSDVVNANLACMNYHHTKMPATIMDVGEGKSISLNDIKKYILSVRPDAEFENAPPREGDVFSSLADSTELRRLGWMPQVSIEQGLKECFG